MPFNDQTQHRIALTVSKEQWRLIQLLAAKARRKPAGLLKLWVEDRLQQELDKLTTGEEPLN